MGAEDGNGRRLLETLERLLAIPSADLTIALSHATDAIADALHADKVDAFIHDPSKQTLVALGSSHQPLSALQKKLGLDLLPIANGGRVVQVFQTGATHSTGRLDADTDELRGPKEALGLRSQIGVPLDVGGVRRGALMIASKQPDFFTREDVRFTEGVARWVAIVAHRAELVEHIAKNAAAQGRRAAAEELITVLAHDLRNFISPIDLRLSLLRRRAERDKREHDARDAGLALKGLARLSAMISEILDVARIDQGVFQISVEPVDLVELLEEAAAGLSTPEHAILVNSGEEIVVAADPERLRQCVENVLSNAIKHSPERAAVEIVASRVLREDAEWATVEVVDTGPGVPPDVLPHIFERFVSGDQRKEGLGLGLYLAKRIAVLHRGDLHVDSPEGKGARFTLELPCAEA